MSKITEIKADQLAARKARDGVKATLLTTIIGEAEMVGKSDGNRTSTDAEVITILKKFEKNQLENIERYTGHIGRLIALAYAKEELIIIRQYLPAKLTDLEVLSNIDFIVNSLSLPREQKSMGVVTKELKAKFGEQYDGSHVASMFKQYITVQHNAI